MAKSTPIYTLLKGAGVALGGNFLLRLIGFIYNVPVVRLLGPNKYGILGVINTITDVFGQLALFGLGGGTIYYLSHAYDPFDDRKVKSIISSSLRIVFITSGMTFALAVIFALVYVESVYPFPDIKYLLLISSFSIPLLASRHLSEVIFIAVKRAGFAYKPKIAGSISQLLLIPFLVWITNGNLFVVVTASLIIYIIPIYYSIELFDKNILSLKKFLQLPYNSYVKPLLIFSWPLVVDSYLQAIGKRMDIFFIGYFLTEHQVGIYRPAVDLSSTLWFVPMALTYLLFPIMNSLLGKDKWEEFEDISKRTFKYILYINTLIICFFVIFSESIMKGLYGAEFGGGATVLSLLCLATFLQSFHIVSNYFILSQKRTKIWMWIIIVTMSANTVGNYILIPIYGIAGAAVATLFSSFLTMVLSMTTGAYLIKRFIFPYKTLGVLLMGTAAFSVSAIYADGLLVRNVVIYVTFCIAWLIWLTAFEKTEMRALKFSIKYLVDKFPRKGN